ncbi:protein TALPID3 [Nelusetta ayraudi]|uniref:protein TALPID3 n=1 Tax=Nelusetta ayraudi TaxID=303726 RepID=UPI003F722B86
MSWRSDSSSGQCLWFSATTATTTTTTTTSLDRSTSSSDTGDVLICSSRLGPEPATGPSSVQITVKRVQGAHTTERLRPPKTLQEPDNARPLSALALGLDRRRQQRNPAEPTQEDTVDLLASASNQSPDMKLCAGTDCLQPSGQEVLTSRFAAGGREVVLQALKLRSRSAPHRQEVRVQLLDQTSHQNSSSHDAAGVSVTQMEAGLPSDESVKIAALMKTVTEARVSHLADGYYQLLQEERERGWSLSQQMLSLLENANNQQLQRVGAGHRNLLTSDLSGPRGDQPAADQAAAGWTTHLDTAAEPSVREHRHASQAASAGTRPLRATSPGLGPLTGGTRNHEGAAASLSGTTHPEAGSGPGQPAANQEAAGAAASQVLEQMEGLRSEMRMLLKGHQQCKEAPPTRHQRTPRVRSALEDAGEVLLQVRRRRRILEENLQALQRRSSGEALEGQLEVLASDRDGRELLRIQETVDTCIQMVTRDIQAEMSSSEETAPKPSKKKEGCLGSLAHRNRGRAVSVLSAASRGMAAGGKQRGAEPESSSRLPQESEQQQARLYGRAPYEGARRTLKTTPYLHFSSPGSPLGRRPRPRLVESIRGVKMKSSKTQTNLAPPPSLRPQAPPPQRLLVFRPALLTPAEPPPMAIPLGRCRVKSSTRYPERPQEVTSAKATAPPTAAEVTVVERPPQAAEEPGPSAPVDAGRRSEEEEEGEVVFPGADFLSVTDITQEEEKEEEKKKEEEEQEVVQLDGGPPPPPVQYEGPTFPPQAGHVLPAQDQAPILGAGPFRDPLEEQLVEWVEQQLMFRVISHQRQQAPADPTHSQREPEQSETSDTGGLQLLVDSALVRRLVEEVLTEQITLMLGPRDAPEPGPGPGLEKEVPGAEQEVPVLPPVQDPLVPLDPLLSTPAPSPPASPAPPSRESPPLATPLPSEPSGSMTEESELAAAAAAAATPTPSPEPAPFLASPPDVGRPPPTFSPGDVELSSVEELQDGHLDPVAAPAPLKGEDHEAPPPPPSCPSFAGEEVPGSESRAGSSCSSSEKSSSSSSSSSSSLQTEAAVRHISEGELLLSQQATMTEGEVHCSFSSSLQEEMDFDPPSEGQVGGRDLLLQLLSKMEQEVEQRGERPQPEGAWGSGGEQEEEDLSTGEVRGQAAKPDNDTTVAKDHAPSSPGQCTGISSEAANHSSATAGDPMGELISIMTSDLQTNPSLSPPPEQQEDGHSPGCSRRRS